MVHLELSILWSGSIKQPHHLTYLKFENRSRAFYPTNNLNVSIVIGLHQSFL
uniref:Uncharacterized protein n=1 Tax=Cajanus cajan TaxID=3821 RepID=A0A151SIV2_CAJCA|nr:hypothetical protein KK1_000927 [Cajanus cajan]